MKLISKTHVKGPDELSIQLDRGKIKYSEHGKHLSVEVEHGVGEISIFKDSIRKWYPPYSNDLIDDIQKQKILNNICEAMKLIGVNFVVQ
ncbi:MAG: hypothetical protein P4L79_13340 [Legionella sp.]|uniref:hypothetical protein n=1 Tax=Legionella sp. TaxID=459 RepID=UPI0028412969|nr:hypothetical protein [Legionella sp.]